MNSLKHFKNSACHQSIYFHYHLMDQMSTKQLRQTSTVSSRQIIRESWLIQDLVNYMWYTIVSGKELRDMVQMWKICILIYTTSLNCHHKEGRLCRCTTKLNLDEFVFLWHVQSWWLSLIPAIERVRKQFPALKEYFRKLPDSDKNIAKNARYK